jgi:hypothetical protein
VRHVPLLDTRRMALASITNRTNSLCAVVMPERWKYLAVALSPSAKPEDVPPLSTLTSPARETCRIRASSPTNSVVVAWKMVMQTGPRKRAVVPLPCRHRNSTSRLGVREPRSDPRVVGHRGVVKKGEGFVFSNSSPSSPGHAHIRTRHSQLTPQKAKKQNNQSTFKAELQPAQRAKRTAFQHIDQHAVTCAPTTWHSASLPNKKTRSLETTRLVRGQGTRFPSTEKDRPRPSSQNNKRGRDASQRLAVKVKCKRRVARDHIR